ncbi:unnamed protein product, partial [Symbiodinium sp. CCMP2456]
DGKQDREDTKLQRYGKDTEPKTGPTGKGTGHQPTHEAKSEQVPEEVASEKAAHEDHPQGVPAQLPNDAPVKEPQEQETLKDNSDDSPDKKQPQDHHANDGHTWPESWSSSTAWDSCGDWSDWSWGAGWWKKDWDHESVSREHLQWRNRSGSLGSWSDDSQQFYARGLSQDSLQTPTPAYKKSGSLDSELAAVFKRLDTVDRLADQDLPKAALDKKFAEVQSPNKGDIPTPTTATPQNSPPSSQQSSPSTKAEETASPGPSQSKAPETKNTIATQQEEDKNGQTDNKQETQDTKEAKAAAQVEKKKAAHARYMRYWRSVHGGGPELLGAKGGYFGCNQWSRPFPNSTKNSVLFEAWLNCGGNWEKSQLYINCKTKNSSKKKGVRRWMFRNEIATKFGAENVEPIILRKLNDEKLCATEVKRHPDLPDSIDLMQFLIFDSEVEIDQEEEVMEMLYKLAEADVKKGGKGGKKPKGKGDPNEDEAAKQQLKQAITKAGKKIQEKVALDTLSAELLRTELLKVYAATAQHLRAAAENDLKDAEQNLKKSRTELQAALDTKESHDTLTRLTKNLETSVSGFEQAASVIKGQAKPKAKAEAKSKTK